MSQPARYEIREVRSLDAANALAEEGFRLHTRMSLNDGPLYVMERVPAMEMLEASPPEEAPATESRRKSTGR